MPRRFEGRSFLVTGAGTGFGAALALRAAQEGARQVIVHYRSSSAGAERTAGRVRDAGAESQLIQGDITSWADIQRMAAAAFGEAGGSVNTYAPGFMETEALLARPEWKAGRPEDVLSATPTGKIPKPEEMTGAALFLASDDAHHITGTYMIADGGYSMLGA